MVRFWIYSAVRAVRIAGGLDIINREWIVRAKHQTLTCRSRQASWSLTCYLCLKSLQATVNCTKEAPMICIDCDRDVCEFKINKREGSKCIDLEQYYQLLS